MTNPPNPQGVTLREALDLIDEIVLAGMSGTGMESKEAMNEWHAQQAWKFISIAAKAKEKLKSALSHPSAPEQPSEWQLVKVDDRRRDENGVWWACTDPDIGRWVRNGPTGQWLAPDAATPTAEPVGEPTDGHSEEWSTKDLLKAALSASPAAPEAAHNNGFPAAQVTPSGQVVEQHNYYSDTDDAKAARLLHGIDKPEQQAQAGEPPTKGSAS